jgi:hypothetical protein
MGIQSIYPGQFDSDVEIPRVDNNVTEIGEEAINSIRDAVFTIERTIGINPQGNLADFVTRINRVIDNNGLIKTSALANRGLVTLPINNSHIGDNAGIQEHKLDLDYSTASLYSRVTNNASNIESVLSSFNGFISRVIPHFAGTGDKHDGYSVTLNTAVQGSTNIESALHLVNNAFLDHIGASHAHYGSAIYLDNNFVNFSSDNVQDAIEKLDSTSSGKTETHQDLLHTNGVCINRAGEQGDNGCLSSTITASTIFQTEISKATNILQVMRPNVARVTGNNVNFGALGAGSGQNLRIQAGGIGRSYVDINLSSILPTDNLDEIVYIINKTVQACEVHYPVSAYNTSGRLTIAHNIPGNDMTVEILDSVQFSAADALGFGDVVNTTYSWTENNHACYVGGKRVVDMASYVKVHHVHSTRPLNQMYLGLGDLSQYGISTDREGRLLCNITNHSTNPEDNGTHYILSYPTSDSFMLSADIQNGTFDLEIPADAVNFENSESGEIHDIFIEQDSADGYGVVTKYLRAAYGAISGVSIVAISNNFPLNDMSWKVSDSNTIQVYENEDGGPAINIPTSYIGALRVFAPDNINSIIVDVTGAPSSGTQSITAYEFNNDNDKFHVSSVHYSGNFGIYTLKYSYDKRNIGGAIEPSSKNILQPTQIQDSLRELRNNGVISGLDVLENTTSTITVRGGRVLVEGKILDVKTKSVTINDFDAAKRTLLLDSNANFIVKSEFDSGYSLEELINGDAYGDNRGVVIVAEFETDGTEITGPILDRRLLVNNIDKRLLDATNNLDSKITQIRNTIDGSMWGTVVASVDGYYLASIGVSSNDGLTYVPSGVGWWDQSTSDATGFLSGSSLITTRTFEFDGSDVCAESIYRAPGLTHVNVFVETRYTGENGGPFGVSGTAYVEIGVAVQIGSSTTTYENYAVVKTLSTGVLPSDSVVERYVVSIPTSQLNLPYNVIFKATPVVRITNSNVITGGTGDDLEPIIEFGSLRIVTSSYSIAGAINEEDGSLSALSASVADVI